MAYTTINKPADYFNTVLYTGNGTDAHAITGVGFQPDLVWGKSRNDIRNHWIQNSVSGATNYMYVNATDAEATSSLTLQSFDSDGFTLGTAFTWNRDTYPFVSWNWLAANGTASNTDGDITSTVSANTTAGFSIVSFTGNGGSDQQVGHGLGTTPTLYITKDRTNASTNWHYHTTQIDGGMDYLLLNSTNAAASSSLSAPSSTTIRVGGTINTSSANFISYVFAEKKGFSKFGLYTGNGSGSGDGTFVYTGFKPAFVMIKRTNSSLWGWVMIDNKRSTPSGNNLIDKSLLANAPDAEYAPGSGWVADFLSNGFKFRMTANHSAVNGTGDPYIYMAFAENPLVTSGGTPATAR